MKLYEKTALITGASAGIGHSIARTFAKEGCNLILVARRIERLTDYANELAEIFNVKVLPIQLDIRNYKDIEAVYSGLPEDLKKIDYLVNNAGKAMGIEKIYEADLDDWEEMIDTNVKGLLYFSRLVIPDMITRGSGHIINIGSIAGVEVYPGGSVYCGSKFAVRAISKGMTIDLNGKGIKVTNIQPGLVETEFSEVRFHGDTEKARKVYQGYTPLDPQDVADIALFAVTRPKHVMIQELTVTCTDQASATIVNKKL